LIQPKRGEREMNRRLASVVLGLALCAPFAALSAETATAAGASSSNTGTIVFFREKKFAGGGVKYKVREGDVELGKLSSGSYFTIQAPAGKHEYTVHSEAKDVLTLEVEPGETYYVVGGISIGFLAGRPNLSPSDKATFDGLKPKLKDVTGVGIGPKEKK
jgi:hypothetical protein